MTLIMADKRNHLLYELINDLKRIVRELGKSNMIMKSEIEEIIKRYEKQ